MLLSHQTPAAHHGGFGPHHKAKFRDLSQNKVGDSSRKQQNEYKNDELGPKRPSKTIANMAAVEATTKALESAKISKTKELKGVITPLDPSGPSPQR